MKIPDFATSLGAIMKTRGTYKRGYPLGAIVHFTAGRDGAEKTIRGGVKDGYAYWCIQRDGKLFCAHDVTRWGYHAGKSFWKLLGNGMNDKLIGIEINAAGKLSGKKGAWMSWFKTIIPDSDTRTVLKKTENIAAGTYQRYTKEQEKTLIETLFWLKKNSPKGVFSFDNVLGHDEVSPLRKNDPGAALSMTMPQFRAYLKAEYARRYPEHTFVPALA